MKKLKYKGREKEWRKEYLIKNREKYRESNKRSYIKNKDKQIKASRKYYKNNPKVHIKYKLKKKYGITLLQYEQLLVSQNGLCAICKLPPIEKRLAVDHCHTTKKIRGLLCFRCNLALGYLKDNIENSKNMTAYLELYLNQ